MASEEKKKEVKIINEKYDILVIGSGGTGTYFLKEFNHFLARNKEAQRLVNSLTIADGDVVEEKNLDRQCFMSEDIGRNKASIFAEILNDAMDAYNVTGSFSVRWKAYSDYITSKETLERILDVRRQEYYSYSDKSICIRIPLIIGCVDNDAARLMCEEFFRELDYCFYYDSGNDFSTGEVNFAHRFRGKTLSYEKSYSFKSMLSGDLRHVSELSCTELNETAPQHILANMTGASHLLRGVVALLTNPKEKTLFERISNQLGFVFFDAFSGVSEFTPRNYITDPAEEAVVSSN